MDESGNREDKFAAINDRIPIGVPVADPGAIPGAGDSGSDSGNGAGGDSGRRNKDGSIPRKRGRKPGSVSKKSSASVDVSGVEKILLSVHMMAAAGLKTPELALDPKEAATLAKAVSGVAEHYNFDASAEVMVWVNLITALVIIYGPRAMLIRQRKKDEKKPQNKEPASQPTPAGTVSASSIETSVFAHATAAG